MQLVGYILPLVTIPYLLRVLGPERFGIITFSQAIMSYFIVINDYGFNLSATRDLSLCRDSRRLRSELYFSIMAIKVSLCAMSLLVLSAIIRFVPGIHAYRGVYYASFLMVVGNMLFPAWYFQGIEKLYWISFVNIAANVVFAVATFMAVHTSADYVRAAVIQSGGRLLAGLLGIAILFLSEDMEVCCPTLAQIRCRLVDGWHLFISQISVSLFLSSTTVVLGLLRGMTEVGYFSAANKLLNVGQAGLGAIGQAMYPHVCSLAARSRAAVVFYLRKSLLVIGGISIAGGAFVLVFSPQIVRAVMGQQYMAAVPVLRFMSAIPFVCAVNNIYGTQAMLNFGMKRYFTYTIICSGVLSFIVLLPFAFWFGAVGAACSALFFEVVQTVCIGAILRAKGIILLPLGSHRIGKICVI
jgi:PST family polysaccharide transporter